MVKTTLTTLGKAIAPAILLLVASCSSNDETAEFKNRRSPVENPNAPMAHSGRGMAGMPAPKDAPTPAPVPAANNAMQPMPSYNHMAAMPPASNAVSNPANPLPPQQPSYSAPYGTPMPPVPSYTNVPPAKTSSSNVPPAGTTNKTVKLSMPSSLPPVAPAPAPAPAPVAVAAVAAPVTATAIKEAPPITLAKPETTAAAIAVATAPIVVAKAEDTPTTQTEESFWKKWFSSDKQEETAATTAVAASTSADTKEPAIVATAPKKETPIALAQPEVKPKVVATIIEPKDEAKPAIVAVADKPVDKKETPVALAEPEEKLKVVATVTEPKDEKPEPVAVAAAPAPKEESDKAVEAPVVVAATEEKSSAEPQESVWKKWFRFGDKTSEEPKVASTDLPPPVVPASTPAVVASNDKYAPLSTVPPKPEQFDNQHKDELKKDRDDLIKQQKLLGKDPKETESSPSSETAPVEQDVKTAVIAPAPLPPVAPESPAVVAEETPAPAPKPAVVVASAPKAPAPTPKSNPAPVPSSAAAAAPQALQTTLAQDATNPEYGYSNPVPLTDDSISSDDSSSYAANEDVRAYR